MVDIAKLDNKRAIEDSPSSDRPTKKGAISEDVEDVEAAEAAEDVEAAEDAEDAEDADDGEDMEEDAPPLDDPCLDLLESETSHKSKEDVDRSAEFLKKEEYADALLESTKVLDTLPPLPIIAQAALVRGRALLKQAAATYDENDDQEQQGMYEKAYNAFGLSNRLNPECEDTMNELDNITKLLGNVRPPTPPPQVAKADFDVLVVGAGAAGIGCALMLTKNFGVDKSRVLLVERGAKVGETFRRWPEEMRFISPSFNQQGWTDSFDLNAIAHGSSPAFSLHCEHPSGAEYAAYLSAIATTNELQVRTRTEVTSVRAVEFEDNETELPLFSVELRSVAGSEDKHEKEHEDDTHQPDDAKKKILTARYVVWAAGEFQYPKASAAAAGGGGVKSKNEGKEEDALVGSEHCLHNSQVRSWAKIPGDDFLVIGGYESGVDAAVNLAKAGKKCTILASTPCWSVKTADPSAELAPYTAGRLRDVMAPGFLPKPELFAPLRVVRVEKANSEKGGFDVHAKWLKVENDGEPVHAPLRDLSNVVPAEAPQGEEGSTLVLHTPHPPVLCTGFVGSVAAAASHLFAFADDQHPQKSCLGGAPLLTEDDESTKTPGVFLVGPSVQHDKLSFCFVYKFRQRFAVVANAICEGLQIDTKAAVADCRSVNMYLDDFARCEDTCGEVC